MVEGQGELFDQAYQLFSNQQYLEAEKVLGKVLTEEPGNPWAHSLMGLCLSYRDEFRQATHQGRMGVKCGSDIAFTHYALASILDDQDLFNEALISIREAVRLDPNDSLFHAQLAVIYLQQHRWIEAVEAAGRGLSIDPNDTDCKTITDQARTMLGEVSREMEGLPSDMPSSPEAATAYLDAGLASLSDGRRRVAMRHFRQALALDPTLTRARQAIVSTARGSNRVQGWLLTCLHFVCRLNIWLRGVLVCLGLAAVVVLVERILVNRPLSGAALFGLAVTYVLWVPNALFYAALFITRLGRRALTPEQKRQSMVIIFVVFLAIGWMVLWGILNLPPALLIAGVLGLLTVPLGLIYSCSGKGRAIMAVAAIAQAGLGAAAVLASFYGFSSLVRVLAVACIAWALIFSAFLPLLRKRKPAKSEPESE